MTLVPRAPAGLAPLVLWLVTLLVAAASPQPLEASSHREAPLIMKDPLADSTDLYAFTSTEPGRAGFVTLIANFIPFQDPDDGPSYYRFSDRVLYEIMIDVDGDAREDLTYQFRFLTRAANGNRRVYAVGKIGVPPRPLDPASPYWNLNLQQQFALTEVRGDRRTGKATVLIEAARVVPAYVGPRVVGAPREYEALADLGVHTVPGTAGMRVLAGPRADGFYMDMTHVANLARGVSASGARAGRNAMTGFNVHSLALEIPKARLIGAGSDGIVGVWASASRSKTVVRQEGQTRRTEVAWVQVSRIGNPLFSDLLLPPGARDQYNAAEPRADGANFQRFLVDPGASQGSGALVAILRRIAPCTATAGRADLEAVFLRGLPSGRLRGFPGNATGAVPADMLRLNFSASPPARAHRLGLLADDIFGFPNGRRVGDDVVDIVLRIAAGELQPLAGLPACPAAAGLTDHVNGPDVPYLTRFPYLAIPYPGSDLMWAR